MKNGSLKTRDFFTASSILALVILVLLVLGKEVLLPVRAMIWHLRAILWWLTILAAGLGQGALLLRVFGFRIPELPPGLVISILAGLGLGSLSVEVLILAALDMMNTPALTALVLLVLFLSAVSVRQVVAQVLVRSWQDAVPRVREALLPMGMVFFAAVITFPLVLLPNRAFDALSYHLEVPLRYLQAGGMVNMPENIYSYAPLLTQMLYGLGLGLVGVDLAGLLYYTFFALTVWTVFRGGERLFGNVGAAWAAAILAFIPVFMVEVPQAGADWSMTLFLITALFMVAGETPGPKEMVLAGVLAGMSAACRHQALGYGIVLIPTAGVITDLIRKRKGRIGTWFLFILGSAVSAFPWYLKNLLQTGDPIYPLFSSIAGKLSYSVGFVQTVVGTRSTDLIWSWLLVPYQATFDPIGLSMTATIGILPIALVLFLPFIKGKPRGTLILLLWAVFSFIAWHVTFRTFRYLMPVMAVCCLWLGWALASFTSETKSGATVLKAVVSLTLIINAGLFIGLSDYVNHSIDASLGARNPERYLSQSYEIYPAIDYLNRLDPLQGKVLFVGEMRGFYSRFPREVPSHNAPNRLFEMIKRGSSPSSIAAQLHDAGFSYILFNPSEWERMAGVNRNAPLWRLNDHEKASFFSFLQDRTKTLFASNGVSVHLISYEE